MDKIELLFVASVVVAVPIGILMARINPVFLLLQRLESMKEQDEEFYKRCDERVMLQRLAYDELRLRKRRGSDG